MEQKLSKKYKVNKSIDFFHLIFVTYHEKAPIIK